MQIISLGGFIDYRIQLANALSRKNTVMLVIFANTLPKENIETIDKKVDLYLLGRGKPVYHPTSLLILKDFVKRVKEFRPDIIHLFGGGNMIVPFILPFIKRYPLVNTIFDPVPHLGQKHYCQVRFVLYFERKWANQIITNGEKIKEMFMKVHKIPEEKVNVVSIGEYDVAPFKKHEREDLKEDGNLILFFGGIWKYKGLDYLIKAEPLITKEVPNAKIIIAGRGEDFRKYEKMMVNKDNFIVYNHYISYEKGAELFQRCSVVALPYIESFMSGLIPLAYGFKKPIVTTDVGSHSEIVDEGVTGFIVPPKNTEALAEAIVKLLKDERLRKQMGENAYRKLKKELSWDIVAEKTLEVYKKAIEDRSTNTEHLNIYRN